MRCSLHRVTVVLLSVASTVAAPCVTGQSSGTAATPRASASPLAERSGTAVCSTERAKAIAYARYLHVEELWGEDSIDVRVKRQSESATARDLCPMRLCDS